VLMSWVNGVAVITAAWRLLQPVFHLFEPSRHNFSIEKHHIGEKHSVAFKIPWRGERRKTRLSIYL
jgi:hypothetical protein